MIPLIDRLQDFIGFFEKIGLQRFMGLLPVPRASIGSTEGRHKFDEFGKSIRHWIGVAVPA